MILPFSNKRVGDSLNRGVQTPSSTALSNKLYKIGELQEAKNINCNNDNSFYIVKILIPIDQHQTEYKAFYLGDNNILVPNTLSAKRYRYEDYHYALDDGKEISALYKTLRIWAPIHVIKKQNFIEKEE